MERPTAPDLYPELRAAYYGPSGGPGPAPARGVASTDVLAEFHERLSPYLFAAQHPGSFSYFTPPPLPMAIVGETLAAWVNQGIDLWLAGMAAPFVEEDVTRWLCDLAGYGDGAWGILASGGVMANVMGMTVARDVHLARLLGLDEPPRGAQLEGARVYVSDQAHFSIARGVDMLGFPEPTLRVLPSDDRYHLRAETVAAAIAEDRAAGLTPFCIAPVAGSTNTGSVDPVSELADLAEREGLWLHVDAAYGGAVRMSERDAGRVTGLERADSLTIDPHKWFFQPYDIGALLVKRQEDLRHTFHREPEYYRVWEPEDQPLHWYQFSLEGTRRFRALKLWMSWKHLGSEGFARLIEQNDDLADHLAERLDREGWDVIDPELSVVCFRHLPAALRRRRSLDARCVPEGPAARARDQRRRLGLDDDPSRSDVPARRHRELPVDRRRRRSGGRHAARRVRTRPRTTRPGDRADLAPRWQRRTGSRPADHGVPAGRLRPGFGSSPVSAT